MAKERRKQERLETNLFAELESLPLKENLGRAVVIDVSMSGFAVETEADLTPNNELGCHIEVPIYIRAKVVRSISQGQMKKYGLMFVGQSFLDKLVLKKMLKGRRQTKKIT